MKAKIVILGHSRLAHLFMQYYQASHYYVLSRSSESARGKFSQVYQAEVEYLKFALGGDLAIDLAPLTGATLLISIPPLKEQTTQHWKNFLDRTKAHFDQVVLISSTSVYQLPASRHCLAQENSPTNPNHPLVQTENLILEYYPQALILRPAGLFDERNHPINSIHQKEGIYTALTGKTNLVHRQDLARAIALLLDEKLGGTFNVCYPEHPNKSDYYLEMAKRKKLTINGTFPQTQYPSKSICSKKLQSLAFHYLHEIW